MLGSGHVRFAGAAAQFARLHQVIVCVPDKVPTGQPLFSGLMDGVRFVSGPMLALATIGSLFRSAWCRAGLVLALSGRYRTSFECNSRIIEVDAQGPACLVRAIVKHRDGWTCGLESLDLKRYGAAITTNADGTWMITGLPATITDQP